LDRRGDRPMRPLRFKKRPDHHSSTQQN
jgi:hypothetical protein